MNFEAILKTIVDECGGGYSAALMGLDGISIAQVIASSGRDAADPLRGDVSHAGIEFGRVLGDMTKAAEALAAGSLRETTILLEQVTLIINSVEDDLILVLAQSPDGNLGKARYLIRRSLPAIRAEL